MKKVICDPGPRNTAFLFSECREIYLLKNIKNINRMKRYIDSLLEQKLGCKGIDFFQKFLFFNKLFPKIFIMK